MRSAVRIRPAAPTLSTQIIAIWVLFFALMQLFSGANWGGHDLLVGLWGDFANDFANFSAVRCLETLMQQGFQRIRACK